MTDCRWCGAENEPDGPCPRSFACPTCHSAPGSPCYRPSGHACRLHAPRLALAGLDGNGIPLTAPQTADGQLALEG